jgi:L-aminopeptidase/D-esterase-like protein
MGGSNTVLGVIATNAALTKEETNKVAQMAHDGLARAIRPAHTMLDGDTIFALATGTAGRANVSVIGAFAAEAATQAIRRAVLTAESLAGRPAGSSMRG